jgi:membrane peptidoglycan carboxypeptidase
MPDKKRTASGVLSGLAGLVGLSAVAGVLITATVTPAIAVTGAAASSAITMFDELPSVLEIDELMQPTTLYYSDGTTELAKFYDQNRSPVGFDQVAPVMYDAILSSEDPRFYEHGGVDLIGTTRAVLSNAQGGANTQGGSSISQQYVKNILIQQCEWSAAGDEERQECFVKATQSSGTDGIERKLQEMRYAISLEQQYSKNDILLGYLNIANFGGITYGVDAAARYYFGVPASDLSLGQAAVLAGIVQNPNTYRIDLPGGTSKYEDGTPANGADDGYALTKKRQTYVLSRLLDDGKITQEQHDAAVAEPITPKITPAAQGCAASPAPYFCQYVVSVIKNDPAFGEDPDERQVALRRGGLKITTTLDANLQNSAAGTMAEYAPAAVEGMQFGAASTNIETTTGRILSITQNTRFDESAAAAADPSASSLVYAGDLKYGGSSGFNAGSTFKIFTLVNWLESGHSVNESLNGVNRVFKRMKNSCTGDWVNTSNEKIGNFNGQGGFRGTVMQFTAQSLNSGFLAMAEKLDLCAIAKDVKKMGVTLATGQDITMQYANEVIGSDAVSPIAMAGAFATVANNGIHCQPQAIDRVADADGNDLPEKVPARSCTQVLDPAVAATAAYALKGVMSGGGTGSQANPGDGTQVIGKTGTHEQSQTWMIESSTAVTTAVWVGNSTGTAPLSKNYAHGTQLSNLRYAIARNIQRTANDLYPGGMFPNPATDLTKVVYVDLPNVVGMPIDQAQASLEAAGFTVSVGDPVDSDQAANIVASQDPGPGKVASDTPITLHPSNGQGAPVPAVSGNVQAAQAQLNGAGFTNVALGTCTRDDSLNGNDTKATSTDPAAGTVTNKGTQVRVNFSKKEC